MQRHPATLRLSTLLMLGFFAFACTAENALQGGSLKKKDDDGRRPTEEGEGLIGYLRDPEAVRYKRVGDQINVSAPDGSVIAGSGTPDAIIVCLQQVSRADLGDLLAARGGFGGAPITTLARAQPTPAGAFSLSVVAASVDLSKLVTVNVTGQCATDSLTSRLDPTKTSVVFKDPEDAAAFGAASVYFSEYASAATDPTKPAAAASATAGFCGNPSADPDDDTGDTPQACRAISFAFTDVDGGATVKPVIVDVVPQVCGLEDPAAAMQCEASDTGAEISDAGVPLYFEPDESFRLRFSATGYQTKFLDVAPGTSDLSLPIALVRD